jgi:preprotein translocase subunit SecB
MPPEIKYPFQQVAVFPIALSFSRIPQIPKQLELPVAIRYKFLEEEFPKIQVNLKVETPVDVPIPFNIEMVGIYNYVGDQTSYNNELDNEFVREKAVFMIWGYIDQLVRIITAQMGNKPILLKAPLAFAPLLEDEVQEDKDKES